jgi:hypothetical protein
MSGPVIRDAIYRKCKETTALARYTGAHRTNNAAILWLIKLYRQTTGD